MEKRCSALLAAVSICLSSCSLFGGGSSSEGSSSETRKATITWVNYDETVLEVDKDVLYGTTPTYDGKTPTKPSDEYRYTFKGWEPEVRPVDGDQTYTAQYDAGDIVFTLSINNQYGSTETLKRGETKIQTSAITADLFAFDLTRDHYSFRGWNTYEGEPYFDAEGNLVAEEPIIPQDRQTYSFYDAWAPLSYSIEYKNLGDGDNSNNPAGYVYGDAITFAEPTRTGYTFQGWYKDEALTTPIEGIGKKDHGDIVVYAKWEAIEYAIHYDLLGGKNSENNPAAYTIEDEIVLESPTKDRFEFDHWEDFEGNTVTGVPAGNTGEKTMRAVWKNMDYRQDNFEVGENYIVLGKYPKGMQKAEEYLAKYVLPKVPDLPTFEHPGSWTPYARNPKSDSPSGVWYYDLRNAEGTWRGLISAKNGENPTSKKDIQWFEFSNIRWRILQKSGNKALVEGPVLDSTYYEDFGFDYQGNGVDHTNWAYSHIRRFLNVDMMREIFTPTEVKRILTTTVDNSVSHHSYKNDTLTQENIEKFNMKFIDTEDKLFLLSVKEMATYYKSIDYYAYYVDESYGVHGAKAPYSMSQMIERYDDSFLMPGYGGWLTRTPYVSEGSTSPNLYETQYYYYVTSKAKSRELPYYILRYVKDEYVGGIYCFTNYDGLIYGQIRPVMWVDLSA